MSKAVQPVIREVAPNLWTFSVPFSRFNIFPVGGRSTAVKLESGDVWLLASTPADDATKTKLSEIGPVKYIIGADAVHHLYLNEYKKLYPDAKVIGVPGLVAKKEGVLKFDGVYGQDPAGTKYGYEPEIQACYFSGFQNQDVAFLHTASKTLIQADLLFNLPAKEQYQNSKSSGKFPIFGTLGPMMRAHKTFVWSAGKDKAAMARDARTVAGWDFDRIIPCHGDVIEKGGNAAWREAYKWYLEENFKP
ncbi:hypothetical protein RhiJN_01508 [Ceratobasidium sp. AG-Ba]|nr:hypothetical protein RhiJN_01508 [Ceratobasidium sp. AG-Ba]QRW02489.1 hypothetical protein RhiLY_01487 [Ceratobasidium sp. AG-Ba]